MCGIYGGILIVYFSPSTLPRESGFKALIREHKVIMLFFGGPDVLQSLHVAAPERFPLVLHHISRSRTGIHLPGTKQVSIYHL